MANGSAPMNRSRSAANAPSTASAQPSRLASPQPTAPFSLSTRTNSHRGGTWNVSIRPIFIGSRRLVCIEPPSTQMAAGRVVVVRMLADLLERHDEADARGGKHVAPIGDQLLVRLADVPDLAVEVEEAKRIDVAVLLAERSIPVDLVGKAVPGEPDSRDADVAQPQHVRPFLPQPFHGFVAVRAFP